MKCICGASWLVGAHLRCPVPHSVRSGGSVLSPGHVLYYIVSNTANVKANKLSQDRQFVPWTCTYVLWY